MTDDKLTNPGVRTDEPARFHQEISHEEISLLDIALVFVRHWRAFLIVPLLAGCLGIGASFLMKPTFTASVRFMPPQQSSGASALLGSLGGLAGVVAGGSVSSLKNPAEQWVGLLKSRTVADALLDRFGLVKAYETEYRFQARDALAAHTRITAGKDGLILVEVDDRSPESAAKIANAYVEELQKMSKTLAVTEAAQRRVFFERQLTETKNNLIRAEIALKQSGLGTGVLKTNPAAAVSILAQLQAQVTALEVSVAVMRSSMTESNSELQSRLAELRSLRTQLAKAQQADPTSGTGDGADYISRYREFKYQETLFELLARQYEMARSDEARDGALIQVVDAAQPPEWKSKPRRLVVGGLAASLGFVLVALYAVGAGAVRHYRDDPRNAGKFQALRAAWTGRSS